MAQYKVPQDVEADDKLIGPFSFRQFVYILIAFGLIGLCIPLWQIFPLLIILPLPFILFLLALALPIKKDQPMETYLSAVISYYLKPHNRYWEPGEPESTIIITAPKKSEEVHLKNIDQEEALHRLSFLADIVDTEGYAIKDSSISGIREDVVAEANSTVDMFETQSAVFNPQSFQESTMTRHEELVNQMRTAIEQNNNIQSQDPTIIGHSSIQPIYQPEAPYPNPEPIPMAAPMPVSAPVVEPIPFTEPAPQPEPVLEPTPDSPPPFVEEAMGQEPAPQEAVQELPQPELPPQPEPTTNQEMIDLANNSDYSIETIAQQAKRISEKQENNEVFISLH